TSVPAAKASASAPSITTGTYCINCSSIAGRLIFPRAFGKASISHELSSKSTKFSILHDYRGIVEFDGRIDMKLFENHRWDPLTHERPSGPFIVPQIDSASGPAVFRTQELFPDQTGHVAESWCGLLKRGANLIGRGACRQLEAGDDSNQVVH